MMRPGFALVFVLLVMAAVELFTLSSLALATHEIVLTEVRLNTAVAERAGDAALRAVMHEWPIAEIDSLSIGETAFLNRPDQVSITVQRTAWGTYYATAHAHAGRSTVRRAAVLRKLDIGRALTESNEAVVTAGTIVAPLAELSVDSVSICSLPVVADRPAALLTVSSSRDAIGWAAARVDSAHAVLPTGYALGGVRWDELSAIADVHLSGSVDLGAADTMSTPNYPLFYAAHDLIISGGVGQGLLFVNGNLDIHPNVDFTGIIVVRGTVTIADDVRVMGSLRVQGGGASVIGHASITYSRCMCGHIMLQSPAAQRLIRARRVHIPAF
jgi:hypothetical protein